MLSYEGKKKMWFLPLEEWEGVTEEKMQIHQTFTVGTMLKAGIVAGVSWTWLPPSWKPKSSGKGLW